MTNFSFFSKSRMVLYATTLAWAMLIFYFSTATFGNDFTRSLLSRILFFSHISVSPRTFHILDTLQRKVAHLIVYGIFATLWYCIFVGQIWFIGWLRRAFWCIVIAGGYSLTDEFHQIFVAGRHPSLVDCGIDIAGAMVALASIYIGQRLLRRNEGKPAPPERQERVAQ